MLLHRRSGIVALRAYVTLLRLFVAAAVATGAVLGRALLPDDTEALVEAAVVVVGVAVFVAAGLAVGLAEIKELAGAVTGRRRTA